MKRKNRRLTCSDKPDDDEDGGDWLVGCDVMSASTVVISDVINDVMTAAGDC